MVDAETEKELIQLALRYEPETGELFWNRRDVSLFAGTDKRSAEWTAANWNSRHANRPAFTAVGEHGYRVGTFNRRKLLLHRIVFVIMTGDWPVCEVDHINGDRLDNRWTNLRQVTSGQNSQNCRAYGKTSNYIGVCWNQSLGGYMARVYHDGTSHYCGFSTNDPEKLARRRDKKARELFGEYARLNFPEKEHG